jgi:cellulose synthase/poly-beta-1,6-N-acetylglucosamine synthase-like glycosyltransferase
VTVVVPSHGRPTRLWSLLRAMSGQTLPRGEWELVVVHTYEPDVAADLLDGHELARSGTLRHTRVDPADAGPALQRNVGWQMARGGLIAFTDDDCRPEQDWLERLVAESRAHPGAVVQGATRSDPRDARLFAHTHVRTLHVDPPTLNAQTCNVLYERALLERLGGFDEQAITGEDLELAMRARAAGVRVLGAGEAVVYHAVETLSIGEKIRFQHKWQHLAYVVKRHPELRDHLEWRIWWKPEHLRAAMALGALAVTTGRRWPLLAVVPYLERERGQYPRTLRHQLRAAFDMPGRWIVDVAEIGTFLRGSLRYRTLLL